MASTVDFHISRSIFVRSDGASGRPTPGSIGTIVRSATDLGPSFFGIEEPFQNFCCYMDDYADSEAEFPRAGRRNPNRCRRLACTSCGQNGHNRFREETSIPRALLGPHVCNPKAHPRGCAETERFRPWSESGTVLTSSSWRSRYNLRKHA